LALPIEFAGQTHYADVIVKKISQPKDIARG
jgi:hypothetical protein